MGSFNSGQACLAGIEYPGRDWRYCFFREKKRLELPTAEREAQAGIQLECAVSDLHVILWIGHCQQRSAVYTEAIIS